MTRDNVEALARFAAVPAVPELAVLAIPDGPGSLDAGFGSADPPPGAAPRAGGRRAPAPAFGGATMDVARVMLAAGAAAGRAAPLVLLGTTFSFAARLGRWMPANRDADTAPTLDEVELDDPAGGRPMTMPPPAMPAGGRCTPRIAGRVA